MASNLDKRGNQLNQKIKCHLELMKSGYEIVHCRGRFKHQYENTPLGSALEGIQKTVPQVDCKSDRHKGFPENRNAKALKLLPSMYVQDGNRRRRHEEEESWNLLNGAKLEGRGSAALEYRKSADEEENKKETAPRTLKTKKLRSRPKRKTGYSRMARPCMIQRT